MSEEQASILTLEQPAITWQSSYTAFIEASIAHDGDYPYNNAPLALADFSAYVRELDEEARGIGLPPDVPAQQTYFVVLNAVHVIGEARFRPTITAPYERYNGHIGANMHPAYRGQGWGKQMLQLLLSLARTYGLTEVQMTVEGNNPASVAVIKKHGGILQRTFTDDNDTPIACYGIAL